MSDDKKKLDLGPGMSYEDYLRFREEHHLDPKAAAEIEREVKKSRLLDHAYAELSVETDDLAPPRPDDAGWAALERIWAKASELNVDETELERDIRDEIAAVRRERRARKGNPSSSEE
ncbi:hypothetical protein JI721_12050 [Alicyclobacillus cycloheptanicus]|uniref:Uncharacterized protein n=1 Tax=Alicyclobacillus cycloheptanicus TaxID=1457 RepID=A0ABT9XLT3_9BACL|nr:hypothetical protein [Alicyclobacillus cycloheptanicus]MDQ0191274.1 hypothetical protein [Alicyclobacillus cycloheptanicus]WDM00450.1 hypothetical protein JI721_12050 [Alicyclobacillus cycloheptanicus]